MGDDAQQALYRSGGPTELRSAIPDRFSFSSLRSILECPLRWQLERSSYGPFERFPTRPNPSALTGSIVHDILEFLFQRLVAAGLPRPGEPAFREAMKDAAPRARIREELQQARAEFRDHPRTLAWSDDLDVSRLFRRVASFFRSEYPKILERRSELLPEAGRTGKPPAGESGTAETPESWPRVLNEEYLSHPDLPFHGVVDLLRKGKEGWLVGDFKTGDKKDYHRWQIELYGLLWYRGSGNVPVCGEVIYPDESVSWPLDESILLSVEGHLQERIKTARRSLQEKPAEARTGEHCRYCDVKQYCDAYWEQHEPDWEERWLDIELSVTGTIDETAIQCVGSGGRQVLLTVPPDLTSVWGPFVPGETLRIRNGENVSEEEASGLVLKLGSSSEVFRLFSP